jgi:hypothetical protein
MSEKPVIRINVIDIVNDIHAGMSDRALMEKYTLSSKGLQSTFRKLVAGNHISENILDNRVYTGADTVQIVEMRQDPRNHPALAITIYESDRPSNKGVVYDITEKGVGTIGVESGPNEVKKLVVFAAECSEFSPFMMEAKCRWGTRDLPGRGLATGFEITHISEQSLEQLRNLVSACAISFGEEA